MNKGFRESLYLCLLLPWSNGSDAKSRQVALINFRFKQLKMAPR